MGSLELLEELEKAAARLDTVQDILLEVNIAGEEAKSGFVPAALLSGAGAALEKEHLRVVGQLFYLVQDTHGCTSRSCRSRMSHSETACLI